MSGSYFLKQSKKINITTHKFVTSEKMPEKVKVNVNIEEENDVKQIAEAIGRFLYDKVYVKKEEDKNRYLLYLKDVDQKEYKLGSIFPKEDGYYRMHLSFEVFLPAYGWSLPIQKYNIKQGMTPKDKALQFLTLPDLSNDRQFSTLLDLNGSIEEEMEGYFENFKITYSYIDAESFILDLKKKQPHA